VIEPLLPVRNPRHGGLELTRWRGHLASAV